MIGAVRTLSTGFALVALSGCESVGGVLINDTGFPVEMTVTTRDGNVSAVPLPVGQRFVLRQPLSEIDAVEYGHGSHRCQLSPSAFRDLPKPRWNDMYRVVIPPCDGAYQ